MYHFALIGCGDSGKKHAESISKAGKLIAVCDINKERAEAFASQYNCSAYISIDDLLQSEKKLDIVSVATPNGFHAEHAIKSLQARKNVVCETPFCLTSAAAWQTIETEKFCRKRLFMVKNPANSDLLLTVKELAERGTLGIIYSFHFSCQLNYEFSDPHDWKAKKFPGGGILYTGFAPLIDALVNLFGEPLDVKGFSANKIHQGIIESEDSGVASMVMENGISGSFQWVVNKKFKEKDITLTIITEKAKLHIIGDNFKQLQSIETGSEEISQNLEKFTDKYQSADDQENYYDSTYELIGDFMGRGVDSLPGIYDGLRTVTAIERIYKAVLPLHGQ
jgi:UDP-N-acetyl-2-amino-2-deoxyglucuronate dehydrogenase